MVRGCDGGAATYEFGYAFGLEPGATPSPNMRSIVAVPLDHIRTTAAVKIHPYGIAVRFCARAQKSDRDRSIFVVAGAFWGSLAASRVADRWSAQAPACLAGRRHAIIWRGRARRCAMVQTHHTD